METEAAHQNSGRRAPRAQSQAMTMVGLPSLIIHRYAQLLIPQWQNNPQVKSSSQQLRQQQKIARVIQSLALH